ncbi:ATP-binding cassette sub-family C member 8-like [Ptychodera flava]|uniref:ATP-binding cassette sub-family C member 8-like n=1 Tax=Ptychodera flava TaxID=63121 RepID=UPI00396A3426
MADSTTTTWFCGENVSRLAEQEKRLYNDYCLSNVFTICVHSVFLVVFSAVLFLVSCCTDLRHHHPKGFIHFPGHYVRWTLASVLGVVLLGAVGEGVLTDVTRNTATKPYLYVSDSIALVNAVLTLAFYHHIECWNKPRLSWFLFVYWILAISGESLRLVSLTFSIEFTLEILRFDLVILTISLYVGYLLIEMNLLRSKVFGWCYKDKPYPSDLRKKSIYFNYAYTNMMSQITLWSMNWLFLLGYKRPLEITDLGSLPGEYEARYQYNLLSQAFEREKIRATKNNSEASLWRAYWTAYGRVMLISVLICDVSATLQVIPAIAVGGVVAYATAWYYDDLQENESVMVTVTEYFGNGFVLIGVIFLATLYRASTRLQAENMATLKSVQIKPALQMIIYEKSLHLSNSTLTDSETSAGKITNFMSADSTALQTLFAYVPIMVSIPYRVVIVLLLLYWQLGIAPLIGSLIFVFVTPFQYALIKLMTRVQREVLKISDNRLKKSNEALIGMKLLKLYGLEEKFCSAIEKIRVKEVTQMIKACRYLICTSVVAQSVPILLTFITFAIYSLTSPDPLTPEVAFSSLALINLIVWPMTMVPNTLGFLVNAVVGTRRLQTFFIMAELSEAESGRKHLGRGYSGVVMSNDEDHDFDDMSELLEDHNKSTEETTLGKTNSEAASSSTYGTFEATAGFSKLGITGNDTLSKPSDKVPKDVAIQIKNGTFSWEVDSSMPTLRDIDVDIPIGKLTMVIGLVGSGKTSLLCAMLEEINIISGRVNFNRSHSSVSYVPQKPWIQNATLKENILFGNKMNFERYRTVIEVCALQPDIDILPGGDLTEIGEKGINLSGGQKQRVSVARALYSDSAIVVMDDPLSAVDVHVGSYLMDRGIMNFLLKEDRTVILVTHQVQYLQYADKVIIMQNGKIIEQGDPNEVRDESPAFFTSLKAVIQKISESERESEDELEKSSELERKNLAKQITNLDEGKQKTGAGTSFIAREERERGSVSWRIYYVYAKAIRLPLVVVILSLFVAQATLQIMTNFWLADWSESGVGFNNKTKGELDAELNFYLRGYGILSSFYVVAALAATSCHIVLCLLAAKRIHVNLLRNIFHAPMRFFDTTPVGRILNRMSNDTQLVDQRIWLTLFTLIINGSTCLSAIIVNAVVTPIFTVVVIPVVVLYVLVMKYYIAASRELKRLESISISPVFAHLSETLGGLTTIRAYRDDDRFRQRFIEKINKNIITQLYLYPANRWMAARLEFVGALVMIISGLSSLLTCVLGDLEPSKVGLAITYSLTLTGYISGFVRMLGDFEIQMNAVERINYYTNVKREEYRGLYEPPRDWPNEGSIEFKNVAVRYSGELEPVLQDLSIKFQSGQKIGICGRTGSGKSSLTLALFRMIDTFQGEISIDNVNIAYVPLLTLRSRLAIIPQDPVLFSGTIRYNLDPDGIRNDDELWNALEIAQMKQTVLELDQQLDAEVTEEGDNFSVGQRQLFCLARAFLRRARILVMDEATASVDMKTEAILRNVIQTAFADITVLTIAHRIVTIVDSDMVLVLSEGKVLEYDTPHKLLSQEDSAFSQLVNKSVT